MKMTKIKQEELDKIKGGTSITIWTGMAIAAIVIFLSGVIEGLTNPGECKA